MQLGRSCKRGLGIHPFFGRMTSACAETFHHNFCLSHVPECLYSFIHPFSRYNALILG
jgi:hypothetical protein